MITREAEQKYLIEYIKRKNPINYDAIAPRGERTIDEMISLVTGLHDITEEDKKARVNETDRIGKMVKVRLHQKPFNTSIIMSIINLFKSGRLLT